MATGRYRPACLEKDRVYAETLQMIQFVDHPCCCTRARLVGLLMLTEETGASRAEKPWPARCHASVVTIVRRGWWL